MSTWVPVPTWGEKDKRTFPTPKDGISGQVENRFDKCEEFAKDSFDKAQEFVDDLDRFLNEFVPPDTDLGAISNPWIDALSYDDRPDLGDIALEKIPDSNVVEPPWEDIPSFDPLEFPSFNIVAPEVSATKPTHDVISDPGDPQALDVIEYPAEPDITIPAVPVFEDVAFPSAPTIIIPEFDGEVPAETWDMPPNFSYSEANYSSDIWADLLSKVLNDIRNGGTGLGALIEEELYDRALRKQETENERLYQEVENYFEARGFSLPPGAMAGRLAEAAREISRNNTTINAEITISQAELAQKNTHFMIEQGVKLEGMLRDFFNQQAVRAFEAAKIIATIGVEIFNAKVNKFNARILAYQAEGAIFESRVKAALTQAEIYKTQIDACEVMSDVQKNLAAIYSEKIKALDTIVKMYATKMEAAKIKSEIEKLKIEKFDALVRVYMARIEADKAKFEAYNYELDGERTKALVYSEQVKGYLGQVDAIKSKNDAQIQASEIALKTNQTQIDKYRSQLAGFESKIRAIAMGNASLVDGFKVETMAYSAEAEAEGIHLSAKIKEMGVRIESARFRLQKAVAEITAAIQGFVAVKELQAKGTEGIMNVGAQLAASAMNAINANASMGTTQSGSETETWSHSDTMTESHPYEDQASPS